MKMTNDEAKFWKEVYVAYIRSGRRYCGDLEGEATSVADRSVEIMRETI